jgi:histidine kinase
MISIMGFSGTGKTALAQELRHAVRKVGGFFCTGKFDLNQSNEPYHAFNAALEDLVHQIFLQDDAVTQTIIRRIKEAMGGELLILTDFAPCLIKLLGQPERVSSEVNLEFSSNRFNLILRNFFRAVCADETPLALVLDDMQWADTQSLALFETLVTDTSNLQLFFVTTCRANEVHRGHPFLEKLQAIKERGVSVRVIRIGDLGLAAVKSIVSTALQSTNEVTSSLAAIVHAKTKGNAFYVIQFLRSLVDAGLLTCSVDEAEWRWNEKEIRELPVTDNVAFFLSKSFETLYPSSKTMLQVAACLGQKFDHDTLSSAVKSALRHRVVVPLALPYILENALRQPMEIGLLQENNSMLSFSHDLIRQACLEMTPKSEQMALRLCIGKALLQDNNDPCDPIFFLATDLCNAAISLLSKEEKKSLAETNLLAGEKAMKKSAFGSAHNYFVTGLACLNNDASSGHSYWYTEPLSENSKLRLELVVRAAESSYFTGKIWNMYSFIDQGTCIDRPFTEKTRLYITEFFWCIGNQRFCEGMRTTQYALRQLGVRRFPAKPGNLQLIKEILATKLLLKRYGVEKLVDLPLMTDSKHLAAMGLMGLLAYSSVVVNPNLFMLLSLRSVRWCVRFGVCKDSPPALASYAAILSGILGDIDTGGRIGTPTFF